MRRNKFALAAAIVLALGFPSSVSAGDASLGLTVHPSVGEWSITMMRS